MLHAIFSIDCFVRLFEHGGSITQSERPVYQQLYRAAINFRGGQASEFRGAANSAWRTITTTDPAAGENGEFTGSFYSKFDAANGGLQQDAVEFFDYLMGRLCESELPGEEQEWVKTICPTREYTKV